MNPEKLSIRADAVDQWVKKGAQLSPTVKSLMRRAKSRASAGAA
jgi:ribosomal protein S16